MQFNPKKLIKTWAESVNVTNASQLFLLPSVQTWVSTAERGIVQITVEKGNFCWAKEHAASSLKVDPVDEMLLSNPPYQTIVP